MEQKNKITIIINNEEIQNIMLPIEFTNRVDELLDSGVFSFFSKTISENIKPFSECYISINDEVTYWYASSECVKQMGENNVWRHNVALIEPTKKLEKIIIGSKAFSQVEGNYRNNRETIQLLLEIVEQNTGHIFNLLDGPKEHCKLLDIAREYMFSAGTTMFDVLYDIGKSMNAIPRMTNFTDISFDYLDQNEEFELDYKYVEFDSTNQDTEMYCDSLIAEVTDVVDRDDVTIAENLTFRSDGVEIKEDTVKLELPSDIWEVKSVKMVRGTNRFTPCIILEGGKYGYTLESLKEVFPENHLSIEKEFYSNIKKLLLNNFYKHYEEVVAWEHTKWPFTDISNTGSLTIRHYENFVIMKCEYISAEAPIYTINGNNFKMLINFENILFEKKQYDLLTTEQKAGKIYYTSGSNSIEGWAVAYDKMFDFKWPNKSLIEKLGDYTINDRGFSTSYIYDLQINGSVVLYAMTPSETISKLEYSFDVEYYPIVDAIIQTGNERGLARSYENTANTTDFSLVNSNIESTLNQIGHQERSITLLGKAPKPRQKIDNWYVTNVMTSVSNYNIRSTIDMANEYSKVHDLIGVPSQYNSVLIPQDSEVSRYILLKAKLTQVQTNKINYLNIECNDYRYSLNTVKLKVDNRYVFNVEMKDSFALTSKSIYVSSKYRENRDVELGNERNEIDKITFNFGRYDALLTTDLMNLPDTPEAAFEEILSFNEVVVHKDAREKLIFTLIVDVI